MPLLAPSGPSVIDKDVPPLEAPSDSDSDSESDNSSSHGTQTFDEETDEAELGMLQLLLTIGC